MGLVFPIFQDAFWQSESKQKITRSSATERSETLFTSSHSRFKRPPFLTHLGDPCSPPQAGAYEGSAHGCVELARVGVAGKAVGRLSFWSPGPLSVAPVPVPRMPRRALHAGQEPPGHPRGARRRCQRGDLRRV